MYKSIALKAIKNYDIIKKAKEDSNAGLVNKVREVNDENESLRNNIFSLGIELRNARTDTTNAIDTSRESTTNQAATFAALKSYHDE